VSEEDEEPLEDEENGEEDAPEPEESLRVERGEARDDAESYLDRDEARDLIARYHDPDPWDALDGYAQQRALRNATRYVDSFGFVGERLTVTQALEWPRVGTDYVECGVPDRVRQATAEAALRAAKGDSLLPDSDGAAVRSETLTSGPNTRAVEYATPRREGRRYEAIEALLRPYTQGRSSVSLQRTIA